MSFGKVEHSIVLAVLNGRRMFNWPRLDLDVQLEDGAQRVVVEVVEKHDLHGLESWFVFSV